MLIFHRFQNSVAAEAFARSVHGFHPDLEWSVCSSHASEFGCEFAGT